MVYSTATVVFLLVLYSAIIGVHQKQHPFSLQHAIVIDSTFNNKKLLLPRLIDSTLWILSNEVQRVDDTNSHYTLYKPSTAEYRALILPDSAAYKNHIVEFFIEKNRVILIDLISIIIFEQNKAGQWKLSEKFPLTYTVTHARKEQNIIYLWNDVPSSYSGKTSRFYCYSFDMKYKKEGRVVEFPEPAGAEFMYVHPRNVLDRTGRTIVLADITKYVVRIYNNDISDIDTLERQPENWLRCTVDIHIPRGTPAPQQYFPKLDSVRRTTSLITRVTLINDTTLLVVWSTPAQTESRRSDYLADVWQKDKKKWRLKIQDIIVNQSIDSLVFSLPESPLLINYTYSSGVFLDVLLYPLNQATDYRWKTYVDYKKELDEYFSTRSLQYIVTSRRFVP